MGMTEWYVIKTKPKQEKAVEVQLSRVGYELFLPQIEGERIPKPLFPSYIFLKADLQNSPAHRLVRYTRGVSQILGDDSGPRSINEDIISMLREQTKDGCLIRPEILLSEGDTVRVRRGLLKDLVGMVKRHLPAQKRVEVLFKWWSTSMRARLKYRDLEKAA